MTFSKRTINQSKYCFLEENYSLEAKNLSFDDTENSLADSDRGTKEKALIRYLNRFSLKLISRTMALEQYT